MPGCLLLQYNDAFLWHVLLWLEQHMKQTKNMWQIWAFFLNQNMFTDHGCLFEKKKNETNKPQKQHIVCVCVCVVSVKILTKKQKNKKIKKNKLTFCLGCCMILAGINFYFLFFVVWRMCVRFCLCHTLFFARPTKQHTYHK